MHGHTVIAIAFERADQWIGISRYILLIRHRAARQIRHRVSGQEFPLGVRRLCPEYRRERVAFCNIGIHRIQKRRHFLICAQIANHAKIRKGLIHDRDDDRCVLCFLSDIRIRRRRSILVFQFLYGVQRIIRRFFHKGITDSQHKIQNITVAVGSFLFPGLCHDRLCLDRDMGDQDNRRAKAECPQHIDPFKRKIDPPDPSHIHDW